MANQEVVRKYYNEMWNKWDFTLAGKLLHDEIRFRGSLGSRIAGIPEFKRYMLTVRSAFPDFHNQIEELVGQRDLVAVRLKYTGTHLGPSLALLPRGNAFPIRERHSIGSGITRLYIAGY